MTPVDIDKLKELLARFGRAAEPYESFDGQHDFDEDYVVIDALGDRKVTVGDLREARAMKHALTALIAKAERVDALTEALEYIAADGPKTDPGPAYDDGWVSHGNYDDVAYDSRQEVKWAHAKIARNALYAKESE